MLRKDCTCAKKILWVKQLAGDECKIDFNAWGCKHTYITESFVGLCTHCSVWKVSSANRGQWVTTGGLYRPTHLCSTLWIAQKKFNSFFSCDVVMLWGWGGGAGYGVVWGFREGQGDLSSEWGKELLSSLVDWALMLGYRLPDGIPSSWSSI